MSESHLPLYTKRETVEMHHRRNSSIAVIERGRLRAESLSAQSAGSPLATVPESNSSTSGTGIPTPSAGMIRRRMRPFALMLALGTLAFIFILRPYMIGSDSVSSKLDWSSSSKSRPYPPVSAGRIPPLEDTDHALNQDDTPVAHHGAAPAKGSSNMGSTASSGAHSPLKLTLAEELGAVVAYLTSLGANARIPHTIDPTRPIDAELILGFNTRSSKASAEVSELVRETWEINPVVMFGEVRLRWRLRGAPLTSWVRNAFGNLTLLSFLFFRHTRSDNRQRNVSDAC